MNSSHEFRKNAENCAELADATDSKPQKKRFERMAEGWKQIAKDQAWLDGEKDPGSDVASSGGGT